MEFSDYLADYLNARDNLERERSKSTVSANAVQCAEEDLERAAKWLNQHIDERICELTGVAMREYGE
jgi:hypothetical protein